MTDLAAPENMPLSCLHLGFYLASWRMFREPSGLRNRSLKQFEPVMSLIARAPNDIWAADAHFYSETVCTKLVSTAGAIAEVLHYPDGTWPTRTVATKILLGSLR